jgi:hypothetical protein
MFITPEELLAGKDVIYDVEIPESILQPGIDSRSSGANTAKKVRLRPLTVKDIQLIAKAAKDDEVLTSVLMIQKSLVEPQLKQNQIADLHGGLVSFLIDRINRLSGLTATDDEMKEMANSPIAQAFFLLAKEFNWTPQQVTDMTVGQILGYVELLNQTKRQATK